MEIPVKFNPISSHVTNNCYLSRRKTFRLRISALSEYLFEIAHLTQSFSNVLLLALSRWPSAVIKFERRTGYQRNPHVTARRSLLLNNKP